MKTKTVAGATLFLMLLSGLAGGAVAGRQADVSSDLSARREKSALEIIRQSHRYVQECRQLLAQMDATAEGAKTLTGKANKYENLVKPQYKKLTGAQLAAARTMYRGDLAQFSKHAQEYAEHTHEARKQFGECAASRNAYERNKAAYTLHCSEFHMQNIPPPHVCLAVGMSMEEARAMQGKMLEGMKRMVASEAALMAAEERLNKAQADSGRVDADVQKQHDVNLREQELVQEFGRLQEEYRQLDVERKALGGAPAHVSSKHVSGTIKH